MVLPGWGGSEVLLLLMCLSFALVGAFQVNSFSEGNLPPPENLNLSWTPRVLSVSVHWRKPSGLDSKCKVNYTLAIYYEKCPPRQRTSHKFQTESLSFKSDISKEIEICVGITTNPMVCENKNASKEVYKGLPPPLALVKNFSCAYYDDNKMNCTWTVVRNTPDLQLLYREVKKNEDTLKPCRSYLTCGTMKTGCHLNDEDLCPDAKVYFVIRGTGENQNRFMIDIHKSAVKPPKPKVTITQEDERLHFQASTPNFLAPQCLIYKYTYSKCNEESVVVKSDKSSKHVEYDTACKYTVRGQVIYSKYCGGDEDIESDMSEPEYYGEDGDPNLAFKVAMIITPLLVCCCLIAAIVLFRRNKDIILPKIPEPSLFFKDMINNTSDGLSKSLGGVKLYVPVKEVVASGVSLEPKSLLLHPNHDTCI